MGTLTTNYNFQKPTPGGDPDTWGDDYTVGDPLNDPSPGLNGNWEKLDQLLKQMRDELDQAKEDLKIPVGGLYTSTTDTDPATTLGYGTWQAWGEGRALVGAGDNGESVWTAGEERGAENITLTEDQIPAHNHRVDPPSTTTSSNGSHSHNISPMAQTNEGQFGGATTKWISSSGGTKSTQSAGSHTHNVNIPAFDSGSKGGGQPHANVQPSKAAYIWERVA